MGTGSFFACFILVRRSLQGLSLVVSLLVPRTYPARIRKRKLVLTLALARPNLAQDLALSLSLRLRLRLRLRLTSHPNLALQPPLYYDAPLSGPMLRPSLFCDCVGGFPNRERALHCCLTASYSSRRPGLTSGVCSDMPHADVSSSTRRALSRRLKPSRSWSSVMVSGGAQWSNGARKSPNLMHK